MHDIKYIFIDIYFLYWNGRIKDSNETTWSYMPPSDSYVYVRMYVNPCYSTVRL